MPRDAHERPDILGRRRVHQDRGTRAAAQPQIAPEAGVLRQRFGPRRRIAVAREECRDQRLAAHAMPPRRSGQPDSTARRLSLAGRMQCHGQCVGRPQCAQPVRPFHQHDAVARLLPAEFCQSAGPVQPPEIEVVHRADPRVVALHQGEGRAWHLQRRIAARRAQERASECALAGAEYALQQDRVARPRQRGHRSRQRFRGREVGQLDQAGRGGGGHGGNLPQRRSRGQPLRSANDAGAWQATSTPTWRSSAPARWACSRCSNWHAEAVAAC